MIDGDDAAQANPVRPSILQPLANPSTMKFKILCSTVALLSLVPSAFASVNVPGYFPPGPSIVAIVLRLIGC